MLRGLYNQIPIQTLSFFYGHISTVRLGSGVEIVNGDNFTAKEFFDDDEEDKKGK